MMGHLLRLAPLVLPLSALWWRLRARPWMLEHLAAWDRRTADYAAARGDTAAARAHLERARGRLDRAMALVRPPQA